MSAEKFIDLLTEEVSRIDREIEKLSRQKTACLDNLAAYGIDKSGTPVILLSDDKKLKPSPKKEVSKKTPAVKSEKVKNKYYKYVPKERNQPAGTSRFTDYLLKIFSSKPDRKFTSPEIAELMKKAISDNKIFPIPSKDVSSNTTAYIWYHVQQGKLSKQEHDGGKPLYQYSGNAPVKKSKKNHPETKPINDSVSEAGLKETIMNLIRDHKKINLPNLINKIRLSADYGEISKNLTGTLAGCTEEILRDLVAREILEWNSDNEYCLDKSGAF